MQDEISKNYETLGLQPGDRKQIHANARHILNMVPGAAAITDEEVDQTVCRLANSSYAKNQSRADTVEAALIGHAFTNTAAKIIRMDMRQDKLFKAGCDIRKGVFLLTHAPHQVREYSVMQPAKERSRALQMALSTEEHINFLRELALVSSVCQMMSGFVSVARIRFQFDKTGIDVSRFTAALKRPGFAQVVAQMAKDFS